MKLTAYNRRLQLLIDNFKMKKIGVIGDIMLDHFIWGDAERISPEAPVPVVLVGKETFVPGGAGNTACNISVLGGNAFNVGLIGNDSSGHELEKCLHETGVNTQGIIKSKNKHTIEKIRVIARSQHVVRIDKETDDSLTDEEQKGLCAFVENHMRGWDGLVISNYAKGLITEGLARKLVNLANTMGLFIIVDTKPGQAKFFKKATLITPNLKEAKEISGKSLIEDIGKDIQKKLSCNVLITQGAGGMTLFNGGSIKHFPAIARQVFDVSGAGDTVVAAFALSLASGASLEEAALISNHAAGIVVGKVGTATVLPEELKAEFKNL